MSLRNKRNIKRGAGLCALSLIAGMSIFANVGGSVSARPMNPSGVGGNGNRRPTSPTSGSNLTRPSGLSGGTSSSTGLGANGSSRLGSGSSSPTRLGASGSGTVQVTLKGPDGKPVTVTAQTNNPNNRANQYDPRFVGLSELDSTDFQNAIWNSLQSGNTGSTSGSSSGLGSGSFSTTRLGASGGTVEEVTLMGPNNTPVTVRTQSTWSTSTSGYNSSTTDGGEVSQTRLTGPSGSPVDVTVQNPGFWDTPEGQGAILASLQSGNTGSNSRSTSLRQTPLTQEQQDEVSKILQRNTTRR